VKPDLVAFVTLMTLRRHSRAFFASSRGSEIFLVYQSRNLFGKRINRERVSKIFKSWKKKCQEKRTEKVIIFIKNYDFKDS